MIVFHEGLPGAGKSYEAVLSFIVPALKEGKHVYTNIRGVDSDAVARHLGIAPVFLRDRLHVTSPDASEDEALQSDTAHIERQKSFFLASGTDCLIVWDEIQDFFPSQRAPVTAQWSEFVAAHRHKSRHIVLMGQDVRDVHPIWRRRVEQLIRFRKLTMIGKGNGYRWDIFQNKGGDKWEKMDGGFRRYDPRVFALYQSIRGDQKSHSLLKHEKSNPLARSWALRFGVPAFLVAFCLGIYTVIGIFSGDGFTPVPAVSGPGSSGVKPAPDRLPAGRPTAREPMTGASAAPASVVPALPDRSHTVPVQSFGAPVSSSDALADFLATYKPWVTGVVSSGDDSSRWFVEVTLFDSGGQPVIKLDRLALESLADLVELHPVGLHLVTRSGVSHFIPYRAAPDRVWTLPGAQDYHRQSVSMLGRSE